MFYKHGHVVQHVYNFYYILLCSGFTPQYTVYILPCHYTPFQKMLVDGVITFLRV